MLAQNKIFALRLSQLGAPNVIMSGNVKIDAPPPAVDEPLRARLAEEIGTRPVWLAASTHADEEQIAGAAHRQIAVSQAGLLTMIAPRHPERSPEIAAQLRSNGLTVLRRSAGTAITPDIDVYLADTLGDMGTLFRLAPIAFMGKSLDSDGGGHNPIEPIRLGACVVTGPKWSNFEDEFKALLAAGGALEVKSSADLGPTVARLLATPTEMAQIAANATKALAQLSGALPISVEALLGLLPHASENRSIQTTGQMTGQMTDPVHARA